MSVPQLPHPQPRPLRLYDSWWTVTAGALLACAGLAGCLWVSLHVRTDQVLHTGALFVHLASLVLGFGAVLAADWFGLLWITRRLGLAEALGAVGRLHVPVWAGLAGLLVSGAFLHPDPASPLTRTKLVLILVLTLNGLQAGVLTRRLAQRSPAPPGRRMAVWGASTALVSQVCWWGAVVIGFANARH
ncbi:hypothetical protein AB0G83_33820 [Streptomyces klenkii]|uniref:hypothetical protein n=1 Tax=Streptomyces klenkii TaxID=1420899 RepID=UPI0033C0A914